MAYEYNGDQAAFAQDRTPELLTHFSDQFVQRDKERRAKEAALAQQDMDRHIRLQKYIGDRLNAKDYEPLMQNDLTQSLADLQQKIKAKSSETDVMALADNYAGKLQLKNKRVKGVESGIAANIAEISKEDPSLDAGALAIIAKTNALKKQDANGKWIDKTPDEIDDTKNYVMPAYKEHWNELYSPKNSADKLADVITKEPTQELNTPSSFDAKGNIVVRGVKGKIAPSLVNYKIGNDGKANYEVHSQNYRLPNENSDLIDNQGQPIKVVSQPLFDRFYNGAIGAQVETRVRKELAKADFNGSGESSFSPNSDYADMLRKKFLLEDLNKGVQNRFVINADSDKESFDRKRSLRAQQMQEENLNISKAHLSIAQQALQLKKQKAASGQDPEDSDILPFLSTVNERYGQDAEVELTPGTADKTSFFGLGKTTPGVAAAYGKVRIIPTTADQRDLDIVAGKPNANGDRPTPPKTFKLKDGGTVKGYMFNPESGNAFGEKDGKPADIDKNSVQEAFVQHLKSSTIKNVDNVGKRVPVTKQGSKPTAKKDPLGIL